MEHERLREEKLKKIPKERIDYQQLVQEIMSWSPAYNRKIKRQKKK